MTLPRYDYLVYVKHHSWDEPIEIVRCTTPEAAGEVVRMLIAPNDERVQYVMVKPDRIVMER